MRVEIWIKPRYTWRAYDDVESVEAAKHEFLDELKDNIGTEHLDASTDEEEEDEQATKGGEG